MISKINWHKLFFALAVISAALFILLGVTACGLFSANADIEKNKSDSAVAANIPETKDNSHINILIMGVDDGDSENPGGPRRSDTMMVASINPMDNTVRILSIPRDSKVVIPGHSGYDKITHAFFYGGANLAVRTVEENFDIPINYTVVVNWQAFIKIIDILGGVDINVEHDMDYEDPYENLAIHLTRGYQHLNGEQAGQYVRFRHDELGDIGRVQRQEQFVKALTGQLLKTGTILKLPALITTISQYIKTDMDTYTLLKTASVLKNLHTDTIHTDMVPGEFATLNDISYWIPDMKKTKQIVDNNFKAK